jgi:hypothetical protein
MFEMILDGSHTTSCDVCGNAAAKIVISGQTVCALKYLNFTLRLPPGTEVLMCLRCREVISKEKYRLKPLLRSIYQTELKKRVRSSIDVLMQHISQRKLEVLLGLSQGYLSRLRSGDGNPSPELVSNLALIAMDPEKRIAELQKYWSG